MMFKTVQWNGGIDGVVEMIDQRKLPVEEVTLECGDVGEVFEAIRTLAVRGAPAIGVAAAFGMVLPLQEVSGDADLAEAVEKLNQAGDYLMRSRPTAVNLSWAINRIRAAADDFVKDSPGASKYQLAECVLKEAEAIRNEDELMCKEIGVKGQEFIGDDYSILTHCNAGALATAGQGTALSVIFEAEYEGKRPRVYADETRPLLQGARLTAWELKRAEVDVTLICDNMAGWLMKQGKVDCVVAGADRIAANGDAANKIGTYSLSVLAKEHGVPFYIAAPSSTFDLALGSGEDIPIEERAADEVYKFAGVQTGPEGVKVYNPAFDVTPAENVTAIITEMGVIKRPDRSRLMDLLKEKMK